MVDRSARRAAAAVAAALLGLLSPGLAGAALAPPKDELAEPTGAEAVAVIVKAPPTALQQALMMLPSMRFGGVVSYRMSRDISEAGASSRRGIETTLLGKGGGYLWQLAARYTIDANLRLSHDKAESNDGDARTVKGASLTGSAQLGLPLWNQPFEVHCSRTDSRSVTDLATAQSYTGQSYGFSQGFAADGYSVTGGFDRHSQNHGRDLQDALRVSASHSGESQRVSLSVGLSRNAQRGVGVEQTAQQADISLLHNIAATDTITLDSIASVNQSDYRLLQGGGAARVGQFSSVAFWRPDEVEATVVGGVRLLSMQTSASGAPERGQGPLDSRGNDANFNLGVSYEAIPFTRLSAAANVSVIERGGARQSAASQSVAASYSPESLALGQFAYSWSTGGSLGRSSGPAGSREATLQVGHNLLRSVTLGEGGVGLSVGQSLALAGRSLTSAARNAADNVGNASGVGSVNADGVRKQLSHNASASWRPIDGGATSVQLGANDTRSLGVAQEFFQSISLQASSSLSTGATSSWSGNLTVQASRQSGPGAAPSADAAAPAEPRAVTNVNSSGSLGYLQQRLFGVRNLRMASDLRLNAQALLPLLGGPQDQETAAWDSRIDYTIGRTQLRLTFLIARTAMPTSGAAQYGPTSGTRVAYVNKSIAFALSRMIGN